jgi:hypothetical protein
MSRVKAFRSVIDGLFQRRTHYLRKVLDRGVRGRPPAFRRRAVDDAIAVLQELASDHYAVRLARKEFRRSVYAKKSWHPKRGKPRGWRAKKKAFETWYADNFGRARCIYVFWSGKTCEYVGKTGVGGSRPSSHFKLVWFPHVTRIDIYAIRGKRALPALECLGMHHFLPRQNQSRAETRKWLKKCPLCVAHKTIESEMRDLFRLR